MQNKLNHKPESSEFGSFYKGYIEQFPDGVSALEILEMQSAEVTRMLDGLNDGNAQFRYAPEKWSIKQVIGHMIDTERIFAYRALAISRGEQNELPGYNHDNYVEMAGFDDRRIKDLLEEYKTVRSATVHLFKNFTEEMLGRQGIVNQVPCSVRALAFIIAGHEKHHLKLLKERYGLGYLVR